MKDRKKIQKKLDTIFSEYIRKRDGNICFTCGKSKSQAVMQCGHLLTRARLATRWDEKNAHCQCSGCNLKHEYSPEVFTLKYINAHGKDAYEMLVEKSWSPFKIETEEMVLLARFFQDKIKELDNEDISGGIDGRTKVGVYDCGNSSSGDDGKVGKKIKR